MIQYSFSNIKQISDIVQLHRLSVQFVNKNLSMKNITVKDLLGTKTTVLHMITQKHMEIKTFANIDNKS